MPTPPVADRVAEFGRYWRHVLNEPEALLLHDRLIPTLFALRERLGNRPFDPAAAPEAFRSALVTRLREALPAPPAAPRGYLFEVLASRYARHVTDLQQALHAARIDPAAVGPPLDALLTALDTDTPLLLDAIERELQAPPTAESTGRLRAATDALVRRLLPLDTPAALAKTLDAVLADVGLAAAIAGATPAGGHAARVVGEVWTRARAAAAALADGTTVAVWADHARDPDNALVYPSVVETGRLLEASPSPGGCDGPAGADALTIWADRVANRLLGPLAFAGDRTDAGRVAYAEAINAVATALLPWVRALPAVSDPAAPDPHSDLWPAVHGAAERIVRDTIRDATLAAFRAAIPPDVAATAERALLAAAAEEAALTGATWPPPDAAARATVARRTAARRSVQDHLAAAVDAQTPTLVDHLAAAGGRMADPATAAPWGEDPASAWRWITDRLGAEASRADRAPRLIVWERVPGALRTALERLAEPLGWQEAHDVVLTVEGVDAQGEAWEAGSVLWYAADRYRLGEQVWDGGDEPSRTLRAWTTSSTATPAGARASATEVVETALSAATFLLSAAQTVTGLRPAVGRFALVGRPRDGAAQAAGGREREEMADLITARDGQFKAATLDAGPIVARVAEPARRTPLDQRLARAYAWYREGRWEPNPVTRFLTYYVALEHIFLAGQTGTKGRLAQSAAELGASWSFVREPEYASVQRQVGDAEALRAGATSGTALERALDAEPAAVRWREDVRPLLAASVIDRLAAALGGSVAPGEASAAAFAGYEARFRQFVASHAGYDARRAADRARTRFTLELLTDRRNAIAHEAVVSGPDALLYARALEGVLVTVIRHLQSVRHLPHVATTADAVAWYRTPWLE